MMDVIVFSVVSMVMWRVICLTAKLKRKDWTGKQWQFLILAIGQALIAMGAVGILLKHPLSAPFLLFGIALHSAFDRRQFRWVKE